MAVNVKNTAIKRILADVRELEKHPSHRYAATPLEDNMFEWHFTIRGPDGSDFQGGTYHGRILLPADYPFKPPHVIFTNKNGRFEVNTKICLSISAFHEESWQPAWGVRTMLEAIISFLPSEGGGAIGALDWTPSERKKLAEESAAFVCPLCGPVRALLREADPMAKEERDAEIAAQVAQLTLGRTTDVKESITDDADVKETKAEDATSGDDKAGDGQGAGQGQADEVLTSLAQPSAALASAQEPPDRALLAESTESQYAAQPTSAASIAPIAPKRDTVDDLLNATLVVIAALMAALVYRICNKAQA